MRSQNINKNATQRKSLDRNCSSSACGDPAGAEIQKNIQKYISYNEVQTKDIACVSLGRNVVCV